MVSAEKARKHELRRNRVIEAATAECMCNPPHKTCLAHFSLLSPVDQEAVRQRAGVRASHTWTTKTMASREAGR